MNVRIKLGVAAASVAALALERLWLELPERRARRRECPVGLGQRERGPCQQVAREHQERGRDQDRH